MKIQKTEEKGLHEGTSVSNHAKERFLERGMGMGPPFDEKHLENAEKYILNNTIWSDVIMKYVIIEFDLKLVIQNNVVITIKNINIPSELEFEHIKKLESSTYESNRVTRVGGKERRLKLNTEKTAENYKKKHKAKVRKKYKYYSFFKK